MSGLLRTMQDLQQRLDGFEYKNVRNFARQQIKACCKLEEKIIHDCRHVQECIERIRNKISKHCASKKNVNGCLRNNVNDYLVSFDAQIAQLNS